MGIAIVNILGALIQPRQQAQQSPQIVVMPAEKKQDNTPYFIAAGAILIVAVMAKQR